MRRHAFIGLLLVFLAAASCIAMGNARASDSRDFLAWALSKSGECDSRWMSIVGTGVTDSPASEPDGTQAATDQRSTGERTEGSSKLSHRIIDSRAFVHPVEGKSELLPLTTRERGGAARGLNTLKSPADASLTVPYQVRRPLTSSIQQKKFFHSIGDVSRPRLKSFGRMHKGEHLLGRTVTRPGCRAARPKIL